MSLPTYPCYECGCDGAPMNGLCRACAEMHYNSGKTVNAAYQSKRTAVGDCHAKNGRVMPLADAKEAWIKRCLVDATPLERSAARCAWDAGIWEILRVAREFIKINTFEAKTEEYEHWRDGALDLFGFLSRHSKEPEQTIKAHEIINRLSDATRGMSMEKAVEDNEPILKILNMEKVRQHMKGESK